MPLLNANGDWRMGAVDRTERRERFCGQAIRSISLKHWSCWKEVPDYLLRPQDWMNAKRAVVAKKDREAIITCRTATRLLTVLATSKPGQSKRTHRECPE